MKHTTQKKYTVMVTGGHTTPALATIENIKTRFPSWSIVFVGRKTALEGKDIVSEEYRMVSALGIRFIPIIAGRLKRDWSIYTLLAWVKIPIGLVQALWIVMRQRPDVILSYGGYVAFPIVLAGWIGRIPIVTHEQTTQPGLANRWIARVASHVCVSFPGQEEIFSRSVVYTGLPLRQSILAPQSTADITLEKGVPTIFITGGSTGSVSINTVLYEALERLLSRYNVIHQVGRLSIGVAKAVKVRLPRVASQRYHPVAYISDSMYAWVLQHANLIVGRSGANTVMEVAVLGKVALWIPLPWASQNEQLSNAEFLVRAGSAKILDQASLTVDTCVESINDMIKNYNTYVVAAERLAKTIPRDSASLVVDVLYKLLCA